MVSGWWRCIGAPVLAIIFLHGSCYSEKAPYSTFARDATSAPPVVYYDYIIIGGGTSGCALAATLSQGAKVLVLERGGLPYGNPNITNIGGFASTLSNISSSSPSQLFVSTDGVVNHRARVLGGGSALNAGFYTRASTGYVDTMGWDQKMVNESYEWVEKKVAFRPSMLEWQSAFRNGLLETGVFPDNGFTYDHLYGTKVGGSIFDQDGHRHTAADLLEYANPTRITVYLYAAVHQILFRIKGQPRPRAYGVLFKDSIGKKHIAYLNKGSSMNEIILSAGALGSPQLLMLSGIGPSDHLKAQRIGMVLDKPMVGQGMSDNPMNALIIPSPDPVEVSLIQVVGITKFDSYVEASSGSMNLDWARTLLRDLGPSFNQVGFFELLRDLGPQLNQSGQPTAVAPNQETAADMDSPHLQSGFILEKVMGPLSTGHLELQSLDPNDNPKVTFNYFKEPQDLQRCVEGMNTIIKVIETKSFSQFRYPLVPVQSLINMMLTMPMNLRPRHVESMFSLQQFCIDTVMTIWHYHGGCQVGRVVDKDYRVIGVDALRVIDGSTFSNSPGTNPQATVMMLGRYMGQRMLRERVPHGRK